MTDLIATYKETRRLALFDAAVTLMAAHGGMNLNVAVYIAQAREILEIIEDQENDDVESSAG